MSTPTRPTWEIAHDCEVAIHRARRRRSIADRLRTRARRLRSARGSAVTVAALVAIAAPLALASGGGGMLQRGSSGAAVQALQRALGVSADRQLRPGDRARRAGVPAQPRAVRRRHRRAADERRAGPRRRRPPASAAAAVGVAASSSTLARIAQCESGGNPAAISADGRYRGKYQFTRATWRAMGGTGDPARAPEAEQDQRAAALLAREGTVAVAGLRVAP